MLQGFPTCRELSVSLFTLYVTETSSLAPGLHNSLFSSQALKYKSSRTNKRIILLLVAGLVLTVIVVVGAILLIPGKMHGYQDRGFGQHPTGRALHVRAAVADRGK